MPKIRGIHPGYWTDEDIVELSIPARLLFIGLWTYACDNGHLDDKPKQIRMRLFPADDVNVDKLLDELAKQGRITREAGTITIHKFAHHQKPHTRWWSTCDLPLCVPPEGAGQRGKGPSKRPSQPLRNGGETVSHGGSPDDVDCDGDGEGENVGDAPPRDDVERICEHLAKRIEGNGSKRPAVGKGWRDAARLMLDRDGRTEAEVHKAIDWCQDDEFWRSNILSLPKLREKYDQMRLQATGRNGRLRAVPSDSPVRLHPVSGDPIIDFSDDKR